MINTKKIIPSLYNNITNNKYENYVTAHIEAVAEYITKLRAKCSVPCESIAVKN